MLRAYNVLDYLDNSATRFPDKIVFSDDETSVSYQELFDITYRIGSELARNFSSDCRPIAVLIDRNVESLCCFLGIVASGNFYVPVSREQPDGRIGSILSKMKPCAVVQIHGNAKGSALLEGFHALVEYDDLIGAETDHEMLHSIRGLSLDINPLYAICTSGTTGMPKGVLISHRSVLDFIPVFAETFGFSDSDCFGNQAPFDFDVSVKDVYTTLFCGASMHIISKKCFTMPKLLVPVLSEHRVTTLIWAVTALSIVAGFKVFDKGVPPQLEKVLFSGEVMPVKHLNTLRAWLPNAMFVNLYGPTEITCNCMYYIVDRDFLPTETLPLGKPFPNESVFVLGDNGNPIIPGEEGEICVSGTCLSLGYYNDPERTSKAFVQNPLKSCYHERMYRTGDLARYNDLGELVYVARKDFQIKHMGHRIELEELEVHLNALEGMNRACCFFDEERNKIVACYVGNLDAKHIVEGLKNDLPKYMIPNMFYELKEMPMTKNGKIDRKQVRVLFEKGLAESEASS